MLSPKDILNGAIGIGKVITGTGTNTKQEKEDRQAICDKCPELSIRFGESNFPTKICKKCGCFIDVKTRVKNAHCPLQKW